MHDYNGVSSQVRARRRTAKRGAPSRKNLIVVVCFLLLNMLIFILTFPVVVWLGAFPNIKMAAIESIGASGHQYLLHYLGMSQQEIEKLFNNQAGPGGDTTRVTVTSHDNTITEQQVSSSRFKGYILEISDPTRVRLGITDKLGIEGETTSQIARVNGAIAAVNAGGFADPGGTGTGRNPDGVIIHNGIVVWGANTKGNARLSNPGSTDSTRQADAILVGTKDRAFALQQQLQPCLLDYITVFRWESNPRLRVSLSWSISCLNKAFPNSGSNQILIFPSYHKVLEINAAYNNLFSGVAR